MNTTLIVIGIIILILSATIHEYMHGYVADRLGDPTARDAGRLTLNPIKHLDPIGSLLIPALLIFSGAPIIFGYAKPVPFNHFNLSKPWRGLAKIAVAGPISNFVIAIAAALLLRFTVQGSIDSIYEYCLTYLVLINLILGLFNMVPIPPLDGSKMIIPFIPDQYKNAYLKLEIYGMVFVVIFIILGFRYLWIAIAALFNVLTGINIMNEMQ